MNTEWAKWMLIIILCSISTLLTYYFHGILKTSTVFTHFYYIPIILSALWWQRKGLIIAIILCLTLLIGHLVYGPTYLLSPYDNYIRIMIFLSVSGFVCFLSEKIEKSRSALQSQKEQLEVVVQERTKELRQKVDDLSQAREAVFQSEVQVRKIIEASPVGIQIIQNGRNVFCNTKFIEIFGYQSENEIIGKPVQTLFEPPYADLLRTINDEGEAGQTIPRSYEITALKRSGMAFDVAVWLSIIDYNGVRSILCFVVDISLEKKMRNQIMQSQKMESIGTLAGGIAHKFNNALMLITGSTDLIAYGFSPDDPVHKHINRIVSAVQQMVDLNNLLLAYARKGQIRTQRTPLNPLIQETIALLNQNQIQCSIQTDLAENLPDVLIDTAQIQTLLTAILKNAMEATQEKGTITIRTYPKTIDSETTGKNADTVAGDYIGLKVEDTGSGMTAGILEHIFEPFYTTHFYGRGLGMAAVYGIVKEHKGWIDVQSQPGKGTTVTIHLPVIS